MKSVTFEGMCSGDGEEFCWDVSKKEFVKVMNREPYNNEKVNSKLFRIYPYSLFTDALDVNAGQKVRIAIFTEPLKEKNL
jgi:hypothetical protein